jgi:hypothetical protein
VSRRSRLAAAGALAILAFAWSVASPAAQHLSCAVSRSTTIYATADVRVFTKVDPGDLTTRTVACRRSDGARFRLAHDRPELEVAERVEHFFRAGRRLGYAVVENGRSATSGRACALNLDNGRRRCARTLLVRGLGITAAGSIAWLADVGQDDLCCAVSKLDAGARGDPEQLDSGFDIDRTSFAVGGAHVYWVKAGQVQSATMP